MAPGIAPVALDAMGGDHAPAAVVQGAIDAARKGQGIILVGPEDRVRAELDRLRASWNLPVQVRHAPDVVGMDEHPAQAMRRKKQNSIRVCLDAVFPAIPYCIDLIGGPRIETDPARCQAFRPKGA